MSQCVSSSCNAVVDELYFSLQVLLLLLLLLML
jgi:hypothetical protein